MPTQDSPLGVRFAVGAYLIWGLFPLYFAAMAPAGAWEILAYRIVGTLLVCLILLRLRRDLAWIPGVLRNRRLLVGVTLAAILIAANWTIYVYAVITDRTSDASLGYFLNPLATVALGVLVLGERLRPLQWAAVGVGVSAAVYLTVAAGYLPWISIALALTFATYGLVKNRLGGSLNALQSITGETAVLAPVAVVILVWLSLTGAQTFLGNGWGHAALLSGAGVVTAVPLLLFAAAARRVRLVTMGLVQFMTPVIQLVVAVTLLGEELSRERWIGFAIVWGALVLLIVDMVRQAARRVPAVG